VSARPTGPAWLILPTYNEAENIRAIVDAGGAVLAEASPEGFRVLIVDDSSPDGTGEIAEQLAHEKEWVQVLHRAEKSGIGPAYLAGFAHALQAGAGCLMEMDSDFSHDPADLARLLQAIREGADLALGSRYVPGGGVTDWSLLRRLISEGGSTYARLVLGLHVRDLTGGFKCFRREVLEAIDFAGVRSHGYAFQVELTYRAVRAGFRVIEVPIVFRDRLEGHSKMSWRITVEAIWLVPALRFSRSIGVRHLPAASPVQVPAGAAAGVDAESHGEDHAEGSTAGRAGSSASSHGESSAARLS
jgi:dolichol-phosphate mannosyltransferase